MSESIIYFNISSVARTLRNRTRNLDTVTENRTPRAHRGV